MFVCHLCILHIFLILGIQKACELNLLLQSMFAHLCMVLPISWRERSQKSKAAQRWCLHARCGHRTPPENMEKSPENCYSSQKTSRRGKGCTKDGKWGGVVRTKAWQEKEEVWPEHFQPLLLNCNGRQPKAPRLGRSQSPEAMQNSTAEAKTSRKTHQMWGANLIYLILCASTSKC